MSGGCIYCPRYGSDEQRLNHARHIIQIFAREARLVEALEQEVYRLNNHDMHLDIGGMAEDATVPCPVCEACDRIWAIIHPEDANKSGGEK